MSVLTGTDNTKFQSPCAGNMFGKLMRKDRLTDAEKVEVKFQSPCAGNMFGKATAALGRSKLGGVERPVSIPVCGEHVW